MTQEQPTPQQPDQPTHQQPAAQQITPQQPGQSTAQQLGLKLSVKTKMSLWFTLALTLICTLLLAVTATAYNEFGRQAARNELVEAVRAKADSIKEERDFEDRIALGELRDTDFSQGNVQLMVYNEEGEHYAGLFLHDELDDIALSLPERIRKITLDGSEYYCYDEHVHIPHGSDLWVRGIARAETSVWDMFGNTGILAWLIPAMLLVAFFGGRLLAGHMLRPIRQISEAAREIRQSADLSKRVPVGAQKDELTDLAQDINDMFFVLEKNFESERAFTSSASHELRTPISVILAECEYAQENASTEAELRESIAVVRRQGAKMSSIVDALLMLTRMEQRTDYYALEPTDISELIAFSCKEFAATTQTAQLNCEIPKGVVVHANRELISLALANLLRNAERYGGNDVTIKVGLRCANDKIYIDVSDNGPGIAESELERVWELFYRADSSRSTEGLGVGLPLVKRIAEYHEGSAFAMSSPGQGATFTIELPQQTS